MTRSSILWAIALTTLFVGCSRTVKEPPPLPPVPISLPQLTDENTPYLWQQKVQNEKSAEIQDIRLSYRDGRYGIFSMKKDVLLRVAFFTDNSSSQRLFFEASYDEQGQHIASSKSYRQKDGSLEAAFERSPGGDERTRFYSEKEKLLKDVLTLESGAQHITTYADDGITVTMKEEVKAECHETVFSKHSAENGGGTRIKMSLQGVRVSSWQYFDKGGKLDHTATFLKDGTIRFLSYHPDGSTRRIQLWKVFGEDWSRAYYYLAQSEIYSEKEQEYPLHRVIFYPNGSAKNHFRFNAKGELEAIRDFNVEQHETKMEEFQEKTGETKSVHVYPDPRRGFIPDGLRGTPGSEDEKHPAYDFSSGVPYAKLPEAKEMIPLFIQD